MGQTIYAKNIFLLMVGEKDFKKKKGEVIFFWTLEMSQCY